jgi:hypothetical protein
LALGLWDTTQDIYGVRYVDEIRILGITFWDAVITDISDEFAASDLGYFLAYPENEGSKPDTSVTICELTRHYVPEDLDCLHICF